MLLEEVGSNLEVGFRVRPGRNRISVQGRHESLEKNSQPRGGGGAGGGEAGEWRRGRRGGGAGGVRPGSGAGAGGGGAEEVRPGCGGGAKALIREGLWTRLGGGAFPGEEKAGRTATRLKGPDLGGTRSRFEGKVASRKMEAGQGTGKGGGAKRGRALRETRK